jgi:hypothetical protein
VGPEYANQLVRVRHLDPESKLRQIIPANDGAALYANHLDFLQQCSAAKSQVGAG